jgi:hypothetical protein
MDSSYPPDKPEGSGSLCSRASVTEQGGSQGFCFQMISTEKLRPNPWNPNRISTENYRKLKNAIAERGMLNPILVRPKEDHFEIVDGEHRFKIARSLKIEKIPCFVAELADTEAKIKTLQLNGLRGENEPEKLARLIQDLNLEYVLEDLEQVLPLDCHDLQASLDLLELMEQDDRTTRLEDEMEQMLKQVIFSVVVTREQKNLIEHALAQIRKARLSPPVCQSPAEPEAQAGPEGTDDKKIPEGQLLAEICEIYLTRIK